ncbi:MAG: hypothetical protein ACP5ER_01340 [Candidatus Bathyarchaeales archaeon]
MAVLVAFIVYPFRNLLNKIIMVFRISQKSSFKKILFTSFTGVYSHVFLDSFLYEEMHPFYPLQGNPFFGITSVYVASMAVYGFCGISFIFSIILYLYKIRRGTAVLD